MINYFSLSTIDPILREWVFFQELPEARGGGLVLRDRYVQYACPKCGKLAEDRALNEGIELRTIKCRRDVASTADFCFIVSDRVRELFASWHVEGLDYLRVGNSRFYVLRPVVVVPVDLRASRMELIGPQCPKCQRYWETCFAPSLQSMKVPADELTVFSPAFRTEKGPTSMMDVRVSDRLLERLEAENITGIDWQATRASSY